MNNRAILSRNTFCVNLRSILKAKQRDEFEAKKKEF